MSAKIQPALKILFSLEFADASNALHLNPGERGLTYMGIYEVAHPSWQGWEIIKETLNECKGDLKKASKILYKNEKLSKLVEEFYYNKYWKKAKLYALKSQRVANEIFIFGVNTGMRTAVRKAQKIVGTVQDGIVGTMTINALNSFDVDEFDMQFDELEIKYYDYLISRKPSFSIFRNGWKRRALTV